MPNRKQHANTKTPRPEPQPVPGPDTETPRDEPSVAKHEQDAERRLGNFTGAGEPARKQPGRRQ